MKKQYYQIVNKLQIKNESWLKHGFILIVGFF